MNPATPNSLRGISRSAACAVFAALAFQPSPTHGQTSAEPPVEPGEIARVTVQTGDHRTTFIEVVSENGIKSTAPARPADPSAPCAAESVKELRRAAKDFRMLSLQATVYPMGASFTTLLRGQTAEGQEWQAISNADFRLLTQLGQFETATAVYAWFPFVDVGDETDPNRPTIGPANAVAEAGYRITHGAPESTTIEALNHLHAYYEAHHTELAADFAHREAETVRLAAEAARLAEEERAHPRPKPDRVIRFSTSESNLSAQP
jgi:hypothetical protein